MLEDLVVFGEVLVEYDLELIGGVVFCLFYDLDVWDNVFDGIQCICKVFVVYGVKYFVLIDFILLCWVLIVGWVFEVEQMDVVEWVVYCDCIVEVVWIGVEDYGFMVGIYVYVVGFMDFELELECLLDEVDEWFLKICFDIGYYFYVGFDLVGFMKCYMSWILYMYFKDIDLKVKGDVIVNWIDFYDVCGQGIFCNLGEGDVDFLVVCQFFLDVGFEGWCIVEQDCDLIFDVLFIDDVVVNCIYF